MHVHISAIKIVIGDMVSYTTTILVSDVCRGFHVTQFVLGKYFRLTPQFGKIVKNSTRYNHIAAFLWLQSYLDECNINKIDNGDWLVYVENFENMVFH